VHTIDEVVGKLDEVAKTSGLPVNFIFVSDHGMSAVDPKPVPFPAVAADTSKFRIFRAGGLVNVHAKNPADILPAYQALKAIQQNDYDVYLKKDAPADWHYGTKDDRFNRVGDILLMTKFPKVFGKKSPAGSHGFLPSEKEMHSAFYAWGPAFKENHRVAPFKNVEVYEVMARILGIKPLKTDATGKLAKEILK
jgi:predicted AlkP superfamily pyrophosphatase or phosphodiesterase